MTTQASIIRALRQNFDELVDKAPGKAEEVLDHLKEEEPLSIETRGRELDLLLRNKRMKEARALAAELLAQAPASARVRLLAGRVEYAMREYGKALGHFKESLRAAQRWRTTLWIGWTLAQLGRLDEAEATLLGLAREHPEGHKALAWVYERRGDWARALASIDAYIVARPSDRTADSQRRRLKTRALTAADILEDVAALTDLGEVVADDALDRYVEALLETGQGVRVRQLISARLESLDRRVACSLGWTCRRHQAYDVAIDLFLRALPDRLHDFKLLSALEADAARCHRIADVVAAYERHVSEQEGFHGRLKTLRKKLGG